MDPARKRLVRLTAALATAVVLAGGLLYTSFGAAAVVRTPSQLAASGQPGQAYQLTGIVAKGTYRRAGDVASFRVRDKTGGGATVPVRYQGALPDPFREGREIVVTVRRGADGTFVGERDTLITKCPSKFSATKK